MLSLCCVVACVAAALLTSYTCSTTQSPVGNCNDCKCSIVANLKLETRRDAVCSTCTHTSCRDLVQFAVVLNVKSWHACTPYRCAIILFLCCLQTLTFCCYKRMAHCLDAASLRETWSICGLCQVGSCHCMQQQQQQHQLQQICIQCFTHAPVYGEKSGPG